MEKIPGPMVQETDFDPTIANAAMRTAPEFEQEYWVRQAKAALHRQALVEEGVSDAGATPSALNSGSSINGGTYEGWFPPHGCGAFNTDPVSGNCGSFEYDLIHLDCGSF
jgi:hypothetical protein